jgi:hypothetical protein
MSVARSGSRKASLGKLRRLLRHLTPIGGVIFTNDSARSLVCLMNGHLGADDSAAK